MLRSHHRLHIDEVLFFAMAAFVDCNSVSEQSTLIKGVVPSYVSDGESAGITGTATDTDHPQEIVKGMHKGILYAQ